MFFGLGIKDCGLTWLFGKAVRPFAIWMRLAPRRGRDIWVCW